MPPESAVFEPLSDAASFAGLLAALTAPKPQRPTAPTAPAPSHPDELEDDVATLSYESALQAHARYRPARQNEGRSKAADHTNPAAPADAPATDQGSQAGGAAASSRCEPLTGSAPLSLERDRKRASVTIRMSKAELIQLQQRAAEAGLTVSAYLRSCTFEVEALRGQVKQALAELRAAQSAQKAPPRPRLRWLGAFVKRRQSAGEPAS